MSPLEQQIARTRLPGMHLPACFSRLFSWIDANGCFVDTRHGRIGMLFPEAGMKAGWTDDGRPGGTDIGFRAEGNVNLKHGFGHERPEVPGRLCVFAQTGREIVAHPDDMHRADSQAPFNRWVAAHGG